MHENEGLRILTRGLKLDLGQNRNGWGDLSERKVFRVRVKIFCRERNEKWDMIRDLALYRNYSLMDWGICWALNLNRNKSVEVLLRICQWQNHLNGFRICYESIDQTESLKIWLDGSKKLSRIYQGETQKSQWIENLSRSIKKRRKKGLIEGNLLRIYREAVELEERRFFKKGKTYRDECNKQAT